MIAAINSVAGATAALKPENWIGILQIGVTVLGMLFAPWWAVQKSLKQFRSTKWWENQAQVYSSILKELAKVQLANRMWHDDLALGNPPRKGREQVNDDFRDALHELERSATSSVLFVSKELTDEIMALIHLLEGARMPAGLEDLETYYAATEACIAKVRQDATRDLKGSRLVAGCRDRLKR